MTWFYILVALFTRADARAIVWEHFWPKPTQPSRMRIRQQQGAVPMDELKRLLLPGLEAIHLHVAITRPAIDDNSYGEKCPA